MKMNSIENRCNFSRICRACSNKKTNLLKLFVNDEDEITLGEKFKFCISISINEDDNLPQAICYSCAKILEDFFKFSKLCHKSDQDFKKIIEKEGKSENIEKMKVLENVTTKEETFVDDTVICYTDCSDENAEIENTEEQLKDDEQEESEIPIEIAIINQEEMPMQNVAVDDEFINHEQTDIVKMNIVKASNNEEYHIEYLEEEENINDKFLTEKLASSSSSSLDQQFSCRLCKKKFFTTQALFLHKKIHRKNQQQQPYFISSPNCNNENNDDKIQKNHIIYECVICCLKFENGKNYRSHMLKEHTYKCKICDKYLNNQFELKLHIKDCENQLKPFSCRICSQIEFSTYNDLLKHNLKHHEQTIYIE